jgi:MYXO-CTERM domain-containing protein
VARAQTTSETFIDYFQPTPISCPLTTNGWGCTATGSTPPSCVARMGVLPRDTCNGIESAANPPAYYCWDGSVVRGPDGTYHLFADRWPGTSGFNPGWQSSDPIHAVGGKSAFGAYTDKGYAYSNGNFGSDPHHAVRAGGSPAATGGGASGEQNAGSPGCSCASTGSGGFDPATGLIVLGVLAAGPGRRRRRPKPR